MFAPKHRNRFAGFLCAAWLALGGGAAAQTASNWSPAEAPDASSTLGRRGPAVDIPPVYRGPSIDTLATVRVRGQLRVGVVAVEPMVMHNRQGELVGFSVDLARKLAADIGVGVEFVPTSWPQLMPDLLDRRFDVIITGLWVTVPRALIVNYTQPTAVEGVHLMASRARAGSWRNLQDYNQSGVTLTVNAGSEQEKVAQRLFPRANLLRVDIDTVTPVLENKAHAALVSTMAPEALLQRTGDRLFAPLADPVSRTPAAMAIRKGDGDFLSFLNTWIDLQREQGWLAERAAHWAHNTDWLK